MKRPIPLSVLLVLILGVCSTLSATVSIFVPTDYANLSEAVTWLNSQTINENYVVYVSAGHSETITSPILLTASGSEGCSITIQKYGTGANPVITRTDTGSSPTSTLGGYGDCIIAMNGSDYVTWNGIDVVAIEPTIEYGYLTYKVSGTNGCQHINIKNCTVTMNKGTLGRVVGIYVSNGPATTSSVNGVTVTADSGRNKDINISGVTVQNAHMGIYCRGSNAAGFADSDITIGEAGAPNIIRNFGGTSSSTAYGIYFVYCTNPSASYNTIDNAGGGGAPHGSMLYGIYFYSGTSGVLNANHNTITMSNTSSGSWIYYIYNPYTCISESYVGNKFAAGTISTTGYVYLINSGNATPDKTVSDNQIVGTITRTGGSGSFYCYYNYGSPTSGVETISNNNFSHVTQSGSTAFYGIYTNTATGHAKICTYNTVSNVTSGSGLCKLISVPGDVQASHNSIHDIAAGGEINGLTYGGVSDVHDNLIYNLTSSNSLAGMLQFSGTINNYRNTIYNLTSNGTSCVVYGIYIAGGTSANIFNNMIYGLQAPGYDTTSIPAIRGIDIYGGTANNVFYNTILLNHNGPNAYFTSAGITLGGGSANDIRNNIIINRCTPGANGYAAALESNSFSFPYYIGSNSGRNIYYADKMFYLNGSVIDDLNRYKTLMADRDQNSYWEDVPFVSSTGVVDLHIQPGVATFVEGNASPLAGFDTDYDNQHRSNNRPDIGADEGLFTSVTANLEGIVIDEDEQTTLPEGVTVITGGTVPSELMGTDTGIPAQIYTITATGLRNVTIYKPTAWDSDWYCWIKAGNQLLTGANPIPSLTTSFTFEYVDFDTKGTATVVIDDNQTLPVELSSFTATLSSEHFVTLKWVSESETNHSGYNIYRAETEALGSALKINCQIIDDGAANGTQISYIYSDFETYNNMQYYYWLESVSLEGISQYFGPISVIIGNLSEEPEQPEIQLNTRLLSAFPNPFNPNTNLRYFMQSAGKVRIDVFNLKGQIIRSFNATHDSPGFYQLAWDGKDSQGQLVSSGIYMYRMTSGKYCCTRKMILSK